MLKQGVTTRDNVSPTLPADNRALARDGFHPFYIKLAYLAIAGFMAISAGLFVKGIAEHNGVLASACKAFGAKALDQSTLAADVLQHKLPRSVRTQNHNIRTEGTLQAAMSAALETHPNVMIHFWATWCKPCLTELPSLIRLIREKKQAVIAISVDEDPRIAEAFVKKYKLTDLPLYFDPGGKLAKSLGTTKFPESYIATDTNSLSYHIVNQRDWIDATSTACLSTIR